MKIAIIGSRGITVTDLGRYLPDDITEIISGGACGVDECAKNYAISHGILYTELRPDYARCGKGAPIIRNRQIVDCADEVIAFWDGASRGTKSVIDYCEKVAKKITIYQHET